MLINNTKFGGGFIGGTLVGTVTSLPEVITEVTQAVAGRPENGLGDDVGSNAFGAFLVAIGAAIYFRKPFLNKMSGFAKLSYFMAFGAGLAMAVFLMVNRFNGGIVDIPGSYMGIIPAAFFAFYLISIFVAYKKSASEEILHNNFTRRTSVKKALWYILAVTIAIVTISVSLNASVNAFQDGLGIPTDSIAGVFLAITTSLPEIVTFFLFLRRGQGGAATATMTGTLIFNYSITFFGDLAYSGATFNNPAMGRHMPLAIVNAVMIGCVLLHLQLAPRLPRVFRSRAGYLALPVLSIVTYILG